MDKKELGKIQIILGTIFLVISFIQTYIFVEHFSYSETLYKVLNKTKIETETTIVYPLSLALIIASSLSLAFFMILTGLYNYKYEK